MAIDRFIHWKRRKGPTVKVVQHTLEDYLGEVALRVEAVVHKDGSAHIRALLKGKPSFPFKRIPEMRNYHEGQEMHDERWLEVYWTRRSIDIITRFTDEFTMVVAEGFADLAARFWEGKRDSSI